MARAATDPTATNEFNELLYALVDHAEADVTIDDPAEKGWLVEPGSHLLVTDEITGNQYLISVQRVEN